MAPGLWMVLMPCPGPFHWASESPSACGGSCLELTLHPPQGVPTLSFAVKSCPLPGDAWEVTLLLMAKWLTDVGWTAQPFCLWVEQPGWYKSGSKLLVGSGRDPQRTHIFAELLPLPYSFPPIFFPQVSPESRPLTTHMHKNRSLALLPGNWSMTTPMGHPGLPSTSWFVLHGNLTRRSS